MRPWSIRARMSLAMALFFPIACHATTFVVTTNADGNNGACTVALCTLRDAVIAANANPGADIITLPSNANPYILTLTGVNEQAAATGDLDVTDDLTIMGGGAATTIIDGNATDRVFEVIGDKAFTLNGVTVRNGSTATSTLKSGGGILALAGITTLVNSTLTSNNSSTGPGGAIRAGTLVLTNSTLSQNTSADQGGAVFAGSATIAGSTITNNHSTGDQGGGLFLINGATTVTSSTISANTSTEEGGGIYVNGSTNVNSPALLTITDSTISGNSTTASSGGGMYLLSFANVNITGTTISGNTAGGNTDGGGIYAGANVTLLNSTVSGNTAGREGGGIQLSNSAATATIQSSTIASNTATNGGNLSNRSGTMSIKNTIVANPVTGGNCNGTITDAGTNLQFPGTTCGAAITAANPLLGPLANNGGSTQTHALLTGSPAINAASGCPPPTTDQRGVARPIGPACDIGSFEGASVAAASPPTIAKSFGTGALVVNGVTTLSFTLTNPNGTVLTGVGFTDPLPAGLIVTSPNGLTGSCGNGVITATAGSGSVSLTGATLAANASCTFAVNVTATSTGQKNNVTGAVTSVEGGTGTTASASLQVIVITNNPPPSNIPTLQQWALLALAALLAASASAVLIRRRRRLVR